MSAPNWSSLPALSALRALDATARYGGFSGAARSLNVTPAAVAQQVRSLEADLGDRQPENEYVFSAHFLHDLPNNQAGRPA